MEIRINILKKCANELNTFLKFSGKSKIDVTLPKDELLPYVIVACHMLYDGEAELAGTATVKVAKICTSKENLLNWFVDTPIEVLRKVWEEIMENPKIEGPSYTVKQVYVNSLTNAWKSDKIKLPKTALVTAEVPKEDVVNVRSPYSGRRYGSEAFCIEEYIQKQPPATTKEIGEALGITRARVTNHLYYLRKNHGVIVTRTPDKQIIITKKEEHEI